MSKPNFDEGIPSLEATLEAIKTAATRTPAWSENPGEGSVQAEPAAPGVSDVPETPVIPEGQSVTKGQAVPETDKSQATGQAPPRETVSAALNRLMAREAALVERENKLKETEQPPPPKRDPSLEDIRNLYKRDKLAAMRLLDEKFNPQKTAKEFWYRDLGDLAPKEALAELQADQALGTAEVLEAKIESTKQEILAQIEQDRSRQAYEQYLGALQAYAASVPESLPLVKKFTAKKPDKVVTALAGVARKHYQATNGQILTPAQAAAKLEASLKELQLVDPPPEPEKPTEPAAVPAVNTLRNKHTVVQPSHQDTSGLDDATLRANTLRALEQAKRARQ